MEETHHLRLNIETNRRADGILASRSARMWMSTLVHVERYV
jgi:hypothetical protein